MTTSQDQAGGMPGGGGMNSPVSTGPTKTVTAVTYGRLCWGPPLPDGSSGPPMKITVTIDLAAGSPDGGSEPPGSPSKPAGAPLGRMGELDSE